MYRKIDRKVCEVMNLEEEILHKLELIERMVFTLLNEENQEAYFKQQKKEMKMRLQIAMNKANLRDNARLKEIENKLNFIKNRVKQGMSQENINKCAIELVNSYLKEN